MQRSVRKGLFLRELQRLVPAITAHDLVRSPAGVRAQAVAADGALVDDFLIETWPADGHSCDGSGGPALLHVLNAPSPAATSSLEIGAEIARRLAAQRAERGAPR